MDKKVNMIYNFRGVLKGHSFKIVIWGEIEMLRSVIVFLVHIFSVIVFRVKLVGKENVPKEGAYIMCANHQSNWDAPILVSSTKRRMHVMAKEELFKNKFIYWDRKSVV